MTDRKRLYNLFQVLIHSIIKFAIRAIINNWKWKLSISMYVFTFITQIFGSLFLIDFLDCYSNLISLDESFLCSDRTPGLDLYDVLCVPEGRDWGPGISRERRITPPRNNTPDNRDPEGPNDPRGPEGPRPQDSESRPIPEETWNDYILRQQRLIWRTDKKLYRLIRPEERDIRASIDKAHAINNAVTSGRRPKMFHLDRQDRNNLINAYWKKYRHKPVSYCPDTLPYNRHKFMMRGKDYNSSVKEILNTLESVN